MSVHKTVTAHFLLLATKCREQLPIQTDNDKVVALRTPSQLYGEFHEVIYSLPARLGTNWVVEPIRALGTAFLVSYDRTRIKSASDAFNLTLISEVKFEWISYGSLVLGSRRLERTSLSKVIADMDVISPESQGICTICQEVVHTGDEVAQLHACKHWYHDSCIGQWLDRHAECPLCRASVAP